MTEFGRAAIALAVEKRRVLALWPGTKKPIRAAWQQWATSDVDVIEAEWREHPNANPGVLGGNGLAIVDVDPPNGGIVTLTRLEGDHGWLPATRAVATGSGLHYWFATDGDVASWNPGPGLEVRAAGRQCVAPPSIHPNGHRYAWLDADVSLAPLPPWLVKPVSRPDPAPDYSRNSPRLTDPILELPPTIYVPALTGLEPGRDGKIGALAGLDGSVRGRDFLAILAYLRGRFG
jgi:hypothetical protein